MQFHEKQFDLIDFTSFLAWTFLNRDSDYGKDTSKKKIL